MANPHKRKGDSFEREIVSAAHDLGLYAERARGSDGRALGETSNVDAIIERLKIQAKRRKSISDYLKPDDNIHIQVIRGDREKPLAVMHYDLFLRMLKAAVKPHEESKIKGSP